MNDFDPFAYSRDVKEHPEKYIRLTQIVRDVKLRMAIKRARTMDELKAAFTAPAKQAKADGDTELLTLLTDAKNKRKSELEKA